MKYIFFRSLFRIIEQHFQRRSTVEILFSFVVSNWNSQWRQPTIKRNNIDANKCSYRTIYVHSQQGTTTRDIKTEKQLRCVKKHNAISGFTFCAHHKNQSIGFRLILVINTDAKEYGRTKAEKRKLRPQKIIEIRIISSLWNAMQWTRLRTDNCVVQYFDYFKWIICNRDYDICSAVACLHFDKVIVIIRRLKHRRFDANQCCDMQSGHLVALYARLGKLNICRSIGLHLNCIALKLQNVCATLVIQSE